MKSPRYSSAAAVRRSTHALSNFVSCRGMPANPAEVLMEGVEIHRNVAVHIQLQRPSGDQQVSRIGLAVADGVPQSVEGSAQVAKGIGIRPFRPEQTGQDLTRHRPFRVGGQVGQQSPRSLCLEVDCGSPSRDTASTPATRWSVFPSHSYPPPTRDGCQGQSLRDIYPGTTENEGPCAREGCDDLVALTCRFRCAFALQ